MNEAIAEGFSSCETMRNLDTSVLVRYLAADDPQQPASAEKVIEECRDKEETLPVDPRALRVVGPQLPADPAEGHRVAVPRFAAYLADHIVG